MLLAYVRQPWSRQRQCGKTSRASIIDIIISSQRPSNFLQNFTKPRALADAVGLTHWGRVTHICVCKLIIIGSDNGLSPDQHQAIIWTNAELLSIGPLPTYFSENLIKMQQFSLKKMHVKMSSAKWRLSCPSLNVLILLVQWVHDSAFTKSPHISPPRHILKGIW